MTMPSDDAAASEPPVRAVGHRMATVARGVEHAATELASAYATLFEELTEKGFSDEQAIELLRDFEVNVDGV